MNRKKSLAIILVLCLLLGLMVGCGSSKDDAPKEKVEKKVSLEGKSLSIYCGAGMTKPFTDITNLFQEKTGASVNVSYGNAAQIISQIMTSKAGDLFIAGDQGELEKLKEQSLVTDVKPLVKHIPVLAVQKNNPKKISVITDLGNSDIKMVLGDNEATPIGKIGDKVLKDAGIFDKVNIVARTTTAPEIINALSMGQCDAAIVWKENANVDGVEVLALDTMNKYIKTIPAATLSCSTNEEARKAFIEFLQSDEVLSIWEKYGYEQIDKDK